MKRRDKKTRVPEIRNLLQHKDPQREDIRTSERPNWFQVGIPRVRAPVHQIYANLLPLLKCNLELISCLLLSGEAYISLPAHTFYPLLSLLSIRCVDPQDDEYVLCNKIKSLHMAVSFSLVNSTASGGL